MAKPAGASHDPSDTSSLIDRHPGADGPRKGGHDKRRSTHRRSRRRPNRRSFFSVRQWCTQRRSAGSNDCLGRRGWHARLSAWVVEVAAGSLSGVGPGRRDEFGEPVGAEAGGPAGAWVVDGAVVVPAQQHEVVQPGRAARGPRDQMMGVAPVKRFICHIRRRLDRPGRLSDRRRGRQARQGFVVRCRAANPLNGDGFRAEGRIHPTAIPVRDDSSSRATRRGARPHLLAKTSGRVRPSGPSPGRRTCESDPRRQSVRRFVPDPGRCEPDSAKRRQPTP